MAETSRFWDGTTVGDATASPYDAETEFADVLRGLRAVSIAAGGNQGAVVGALGGALVAAGTVGSVTVQDGYAFVWGNWYHNDAPVAFVIPTPAVSTRIDRIVLRKDWTAQTVRLTLISGVEGGSEPSMTQVVGTTWDIPIASASITTGGVITTTDERDLSAPVGASVFVPWVGGGPFPITTINNPGDGVPHTYVLTGVPANATAAVIAVKYTSGSVTFWQIATTGAGTTTVWEPTNASTPNTIETPFIVPLATPTEISVGSGGGGALIFDVIVIGWYVPLY